MATFDDVRSIALGLPEAEEVLTWETDVTFRVRGKIFAIGGDGSPAVSIKATPMVQSDLIDRDPATFSRSAYVGRFGWVTVQLERVDLPALERLLTDAWRATAPKRLAATLANSWPVDRQPETDGRAAHDSTWRRSDAGDVQ